MYRSLLILILVIISINQGYATERFMPSYEKFQHYVADPLAPVGAGGPPPVPAPNAAYTQYDEATIIAQMNAPLLPALDSNAVNIEIGVSKDAGGGAGWVHTVEDVTTPLALPDLINMAIERNLRGIRIEFNPWPPVVGQFTAGGYLTALGKALHGIKHVVPQIDYVNIPGDGEAQQIALHFHLLKRASKNMRDIQFNGFPFVGQQTIKSIIDQQFAMLAAAGVPLAPHSSVSVVSYLYAQMD